MARPDAQQQSEGSFRSPEETPPIADEGLFSEPTDPLALDIDDDELAEVVDKRITDIRQFYETEYDLYARRKKNEEFLFGKQIINKEKDHALKDYESKFQDNVLYEIEANLKPLAMSRLPDLIVTPGNDSEQSRLMAQEISKAIDTDIKKRENRMVLGLAFKHLPAYFTGVIKARWDPELDDYVFETIHPDLVDVDYTSPKKDANSMKLISQIVPLTVEEILMRFPGKEREFIDELGKRDGIKVKDGQEPTWKQLATVVKIREVWFKWYKRHSDTEYEPIWGVMWKYYDCILKKMKNPNFDYEGEKKFVIYDDQGVKRQPTQEELTAALVQTMVVGQPPEGLVQEQVYHNYLDHPPMPFYFFGYDQWGKQPFDETSHMEQNIKNQASLDKRGKQIDETLNNRGHHVYSKESGLKPSDIQQMDMNDPDQDVIVDGDVNNVHKYIEPPRPDQSEFASLNGIIDRMHQLAGDNAVQGEIQSDTATTNQIARESNFTRADDLVEDTINAAAEWMAQMALHFIKLRYTEDHWRRILGVAGRVVFLKLNRNMIDEGMQVMIKASGTDRLQAKNNAMDLSKLQMIDPVTFLRDMGYPDYQERAQMLMAFKTDLSTYMIKYVQDLQTSADMANALMQSPIDELQPGMGMQPGMPPQPGLTGQPPGAGAPMPPPPGMTPPGTAPQNPTPGNTAQAPMSPPPGPPQGSPRML